MSFVSRIYWCLNQLSPHSLGRVDPLILSISILWLIRPAWLSVFLPVRASILTSQSFNTIIFVESEHLVSSFEIWWFLVPCILILSLASLAIFRKFGCASHNITGVQLTSSSFYCCLWGVLVLEIFPQLWGPDMWVYVGVVLLDPLILCYSMK